MEILKLKQVQEIDRNKNIVIYGAGTTGKVCLDVLSADGYEVNCFVDDDINKVGKCIYNKAVISLEHFEQTYIGRSIYLVIGSIFVNVILDNLRKREFFKTQDCIIVYMKEIYNQSRESDLLQFIRMQDEKFVKGNFDQLYEICPDQESKRIINTMKKVYFEQYIGLDIYDNICTREAQYFTDKVVSILKKNNNRILDAGAFHGEILSDLLRFEIPLEKLVLFEVDIENFEKVRENVGKSILSKVCVPVNLGLWDKSSVVYLDGEGDTCKITNKVTDKKMQVVSIDEFYKDERIDFIKMDIEGAEGFALRGGADTIRRDRPVLAICIYHSPEDFVGIPIYLKNLLENYTFSILHHTNEYVESILYAIPDEKQNLEQ